MPAITSGRIARVLNRPVRDVLVDLFDHMNVATDDPIRNRWPLAITLSDESARRYADRLDASDRQKIVGML